MRSRQNIDAKGRKGGMRIAFLSSLIRLRLLPLTIAFSFLLLGVKTVDIVRGTNEFSNMLIAGRAEAVTPDASAEDVAKEEDKKEEAPAIDPKAHEKVEGDSGETHEGTAAGEETKEKTEPKKEKKHFTQIELDLLQSLSERREELERWEQEVRMKESLLEATEVRINTKIEEINGLETTVRKLLEEYNKLEDAKIRSLVRIYESMKPKDAARIFDELELPILLMVVDRMSERKAAPILAKMNPMKAKQLTVQLAAQRKIITDSKNALGGVN